MNIKKRARRRGRIAAMAAEKWKVSEDCVVATDHVLAGPEVRAGVKECDSLIDRRLCIDYATRLNQWPAGKMW